MLERALAAVPISSGPLTIADFGSSQGHNSMRQIALALDRLTLRAGRGRDMSVVHTDLPQCAFTSLFATLETAPVSYRRGRDHVFASAIGRSFHERLLPADSPTFGWSAFALHWMSALPLALCSHIWPIFATPDEAGPLARWRRLTGGTSSPTVPES